MKKPLTPLQIRVGKLKEVAADAREKLAAEVFAVSRIEEAMSAEAVKGYTTLTVMPPLPLDLSGTEAARELLRQLTEAGARCEWQPRRPTGPDGPVVQALTISW